MEYSLYGWWWVPLQATLARETVDRRGGVVPNEPSYPMLGLAVRYSPTLVTTTEMGRSPITTFVGPATHPLTREGGL